MEPQDPASPSTFRSAFGGTPQLQPVGDLPDEALVEDDYYDRPIAVLTAKRDGLIDLARNDSDLTIPQRQGVQGTVQRLTRAIDMAREREKRSKERSRPTGCWCLGLGGRGQRGLAIGSPLDMTALHPRMSVDQFIMPGDSAAPLGAKNYCTCPEGLLREAKELAMRTGWLNGWQEANRVADLQKRWDASGLPAPRFVRALTDYPQRTLEQRATIKAIRDWKIARWMYLEGDVQLGKTTLAQAIARLVLERGHTARFTEVSTLMDHLRGGFSRNESQEDLLRPYKECEYLFLDDIGVARGSTFMLTQLFQILEYRKQREAPVVFTSNRCLKPQDGQLDLQTVLLGIPEGPTREAANSDDLDLSERTELVARISARMKIMCDIVPVKGPPFPVTNRNTELALEWDTP